jgi:peptide/nickel transport system permease protein
VLKLVGRRLVWAPLILVAVSFLVFALVDLAPALVAQLRHQLRLDDPMPVRYVRWLGNALHGDLGNSFFTRQPVGKTVWHLLPINLSMTLVAMVMIVVGGVIFGVVGALRPRGLVDRLVTVIASLAVAIPGFWLGLLMVLYLSVYHRFLPAIGFVPFSESPWEWLRHLLMPCFALATVPIATVALQLKGSLVETLGRDYILTARAKGLGGLKIVFKHALRNAAIPVVTILGLQVAFLLGGSVVIENVFGIVGLGTYLIGAAQGGDINAILGVVVLATLIALLMNAAVDIAYGFLNPKLRV